MKRIRKWCWAVLAVSVFIFIFSVTNVRAESNDSQERKAPAVILDKRSETEVRSDIVTKNNLIKDKGEKIKSSGSSGSGSVVTFVVLLVVLGTVGTGAFFIIYSKFNHWSPKSGKTLSVDAVVTGVETKLFNSYNFKTKVTFSDGFRYVAFDTQKQQGENHITYYTKRLSVTREMADRIVIRAIDKHAEIVSDYYQNAAGQQEGSVGLNGKRI